MKRSSLLVMAMIMAALSSLPLLSCSHSSSGGGDEDDEENPVPAISNLQYSSTAYRGQAFTGSFDYHDPDGDIEKVYVQVSGSGGSQTYSYTADELGISGTSGTATVTITINPFAPPGNYHFEVWVEDAADHTSNKLAADVNVKR